MFCCNVLIDVIILRSRTAELIYFISVPAVKVRVRDLTQTAQKKMNISVRTCATVALLIHYYTPLWRYPCMPPMLTFACLFVRCFFSALFLSFCFRLCSRFILPELFLFFILLSFSLSLPSLYLFIFHPYFPPSSSSSSSTSLLPAFLPPCPFHLTRALSPPSRHYVQQHQLYHLAGKLASPTSRESERRPGGL